MKILIVDSNNEDMSQICTFLHKLGHLCFVARNYDEAMLLLGKEDIEVIMSEWGTEYEDGKRTCIDTRKFEGTFGFVYIIAFTKYSRKHDKLQALECGVDDVIIKPTCRLELKAKLKAAQRLVSLRKRLTDQRVDLIKNCMQLQIANEKIRKLAITDELTELYNRRHCLSRFKELWSMSNRQKQELSCILLDIDYFKNFNDTHGHDVGDKVLKHVAKLLKRGSRTEDIISRIGGEEFLIICPNTNSSQAEECAERLRSLIEENPLARQGIILKVTISVGVSTKDKNSKCQDDLITKADEMLYRAKKTGRNKVCSV